MCRKVSFLKLMFFCLITTIIVVELTFSKYETTLSKSTNAVIALMADDIITDIIIPDGMYPGSEPSVVAISVTNEDNGKVSQVSQEYMMKIVRNEQVNIPFEFELYNDENCTQLLEANENGYYYDTGFTFDAGVKNEHTYYLKLYWPEEYNDSGYAFEIDYISFLVDVIQQD